MVVGKSLGEDKQSSSPGLASFSNKLITAKDAVSIDQRLSLLILTQFFPPDFAATGQLIEELAKQLGRQGVKVEVFTGQPNYAFKREDAPRLENVGLVSVRRSRLSRLFHGRIRGKALNGLLFAVRSILHLVRRSRSYDVVLVTTAPPFLPAIAYFANLLFKTQYICLIYDLYPDIAIELDVIRANHPIARFWQFINKLVWRRAEQIIVLSDSMKQRVSDRCRGISDKISVIHSWSNEKQIVPIDKEENWFAKEHDLVDPFVVMYSGNMGRCHDISTLFHAACLLKDEPVIFMCIGSGAKRDKLKADVAAYGLNNVRFLPYQEKTVLPYSLTASDLFIVSVADGMESLVAPSKLYPAMATGRPIAAICPSRSYLNGLLKTADCGASFENGESQKLADYIRSLAHNRTEAQKVGASGRKYLEANFTPELISHQYLSVIRSAISANKPRRALKLPRMKVRPHPLE